jgi:aldose 1-epimerase
MRHGKVASLTGATGICLELHTTEPGLQFYDGGKLDIPVAGLDGHRYANHAGLCLEPQRWPDSIHHSSFAGAILQTGEHYHQRSEYRLSSVC